MKRKMLQLFLSAIAALVLFAPPSGYGQIADVFRKGEVIGKVFCNEDPKQSYALYLPSNYTHDKEWPIIYCFDFMAEGSLPVERFKEAAEKYGYIIAGSNNSKNGPVELSLAAFDAMWKDTHIRFSIDDARIYTAGFSGGARIASLAASLCNGCITGVIACGSGFQTGLAPTKKTSFVYFGTVGTDDFNYPEMKSLEKSFSKLGVANRLAEFEGWHTWAPKEVCTRAIEWMELQAMKKKKRERDDALIDVLFNRDMEEAAACEQNGKIYEAYLRYKSLAADFKGLRDVSVYEKKTASLKETEGVRKGIAAEQNQALRQKEIEDEILDYTDMLADSESRVTALGRLKRRIADLRKVYEQPEDNSERRVVRRAITHLFEVFFELGSIKHEGNYALATANLEVAVEMNPKDARASYRLACAYSMKGEKNKALASLRKAVEKGYTNIAAIESNRELDGIRQEAEYKRILNGLKGE